MDYSRNWLFIADKVQKKLANLKVLVVGAGIGSVFAETALRTGIKHLTIADGDCVDVSNLNRQNYVASDIGSNKSLACKKRLLAIDPEAEIKSIPKYLQEQELMDFIPKHQIVTNTIDFDANEFVICQKICKQNKVLELFPINMGFGTVVSLLGPSSPTMQEYFASDNHRSIKRAILENLAASDQMASYLKEAALRYFQKESDFDPQLAISTQMTAAMMNSLLVEVVSGEKIHYFPDVYYLDAKGGRIIKF